MPSSPRTDSARPELGRKEPLPPDPETEELWNGLLAGKEEAFAKVERMVGEVCPRALRRHGAPPALIPQLLSEILSSVGMYVQASRDGGGGARRQPQRIREFLKYRARGVLTEHERAGRRRSSSDLLDVDPPDPAGDMETADRLIAEETSEAYEDCLAKLPRSYAVVWTARRVRELTTEQTAAELGITKGAVALRLHRAARQLRECLRHKGVIS